MQTIVIASSNKNKFRELQHSANDFGITLKTPEEIRQEKNLPPYISPEENGSTFLENAKLKAKSCFLWCGCPSLADDSGLEVDALNGAPGIYSARFGGPNLTDEERIYALLKAINEKQELSDEPLTRKARFYCALALWGEDSSCKLNSEGILNGSILKEPRGDRGFGYDSIVLIDSISKTLAEINEETLFQIGFRGQAVRDLFSNLS